MSGFDLIGTLAKATQDLVAGFDSFVKGHVHLHRLTGTRISAVMPCLHGSVPHNITDVAPTHSNCFEGIVHRLRKRD